MGVPTNALLFSGGRDSCVLLHIMEPWLGETVVVWVNTGAAFESTIKQMEQVKTDVPHFFEVRTDQPADIAKWGYPTDILPVRHDIQLHGYREPKLQSTASCCAKSIWIPIKLALADLKVTAVYSGVREDEEMKDARWPMTIDGIQYKYPLKKWTKQMVQDYVIKHNIWVPPYYDTEGNSRDCWSCTGYLWERKEQIANLPLIRKRK